jgi:hypothetical protein
MRSKRRPLFPVPFYACLSLLIAACPVDPSLPERPPLDPAEYVYDASAKGYLRMASGEVRTAAAAIQSSSSPDFHVPSSFESCLRLFVNFEGSDLALFLQLKMEGGEWVAKDSRAYLAWCRYPDGFANGMPYYSGSIALSVTTAADPAVVESISLSSASWAQDAGEPGGERAVAEVSVSIDLDVLGYATVDYQSSAGADRARCMDTRAALAGVSPELDENVRADPEAYGDDLALALTAGLADPALKMRAIYDWIGEHVYYDDWWKETYYDVDPAGDYDEFVDKSPCAVLKSRKTVCGGYALLFDWLCRAVGLRAPIVRGWVRSMDEPTTRMDHTWNAVSLNGRLFHVDANNGTANSYTKPGGVETWTHGARDASWCFVPEETFRARRNPYEAAYRYPGQSESGDDFYAETAWPQTSLVASIVKDAFYERGFSLPDGALPGILVCDGLGVARIGLPGPPWPTITMSSVKVAGSLTNYREAYAERIGSLASICADPVDSGYRLVYLWEYVSESEYYHLATLVARDAGGAPLSAPLARRFSTYMPSGAVLTSPSRDSLMAGSSVEFSVSTPGATRYYLRTGPSGTYSYAYHDAVAGALPGSHTAPSDGNSWALGVEVGGVWYALVEYTFP